MTGFQVFSVYNDKSIPLVLIPGLLTGNIHPAHIFMERFEKEILRLYDQASPHQVDCSNAAENCDHDDPCKMQQQNR